MESDYTDPKELVCLNCPIVSGCNEKSKDCLYQNSKRDENGLTANQKHYRKTHPNARPKLTNEELRLHRIENQKKYRKRIKIIQMKSQGEST